MKEYLEVILYILTNTLEHTCGIVGSSKFNNMTSLPIKPSTLIYYQLTKNPKFVTDPNFLVVLHQ